MLLVHRYSYFIGLIALTACLIVAVVYAIAIVVVGKTAIDPVVLAIVLAIVALVGVVEVVIEAVVAVMGTLEDRILFCFSADQELAEQHAEKSLVESEYAVGGLLWLLPMLSLLPLLNEQRNELVSSRSDWESLPSSNFHNLSPPARLGDFEPSPPTTDSYSCENIL